MAELNHTPASDRFISALQQASVSELDAALTGKRMSDFERDMVRKAHAMLHGDTPTADRWLMDYADILDDDQMTDRARCLADLVDAIAETA